MITILRLKNMMRFLVLSIAFLGMHTEIMAQTNPTAQALPYSQNFGTSSFSTMPSGMISWQGNGNSISTQALAESSVPSANATLTGATAVQTTGASYGYATSSNGRAYIQQSSNTSNGANQFALAVVTTGKTDITVAYSVEMISAVTRTTGIVMQYRVGVTGDWTTVAGTGNPFSQSGGTAGIKATPSIVLPAAANNKAVVQIRWATWRGTESGSSGGIAIDNISVTGTNIPTTSAASDIVADATFTPTSNIAYNNYQAALTLTDINSIEVGRFTIRDGGATSDADTAATILNAISFSVTNPGNLRALAIFDGTTNVGEITTVGATASFTGLTLSAGDGSTKTFSVRATFKNSVTDNQQFALTVSAATASGSGSGFAASNAGAATTPVATDENRIEVTATHLLFDVNPSATQINIAMVPAVTVKATDVNANFDLDFTGTVSLSTTGTFAGGATTSVAAVAGTATFNNILFSAPGTGLTIEASATGVTSTGNSPAFNVTNPAPEINVAQNVTNIASGGSFAAGNLASGTSGSAVTFTIQNTGNANLTIASVTNGNTTDFTLDTTAVSSPVAASGSTAFTVTFHPTTQGAKSALITINNNDSDEGTYTFTVSGNGTVSTASNIVYNTSFTPTSNIVYGNFQAASGLSTLNSVNAAGFVIQDGAGSADSDNLGTTLTAVTFNVSGTAAAQIRTAALFDGGVNIAEVAVNGSTTIAFSGLSLTAADGGSHNFELHVTLLGTVTDNTQFGFAIASATANAAGSVFASANAGAASSDISGDVNRIEVTATTLVYVQQPTNTILGANIAPAVTVAAIDGNNKTDLDFTGMVSITSAAPLTTTQDHAAVNGIATFSTISFSAAGTGYTLGSNSTGLAGATSNTFDVTVQAAGVLLMEDNFEYTAASNLTSNGWGAHSGGGSNPVKVHTTGLDYAGYGSTNTGLAAIFNANGEDVNKVFGARPSGSVTYAAFLINVTEATAGGDYVVMLAPETTGSEFRARFYTRFTGGNLQFGVSSTGAAQVYAPGNYAYNTTYLIVLKHTYNSGTALQTTEMFVNPSVYTEPQTANASQSTSASSNGIGSIAFRQNSASNKVIIDGVRIATNWGTALGNPQYDATATINAGHYNTVTVLDGTLTAAGSLTVNNEINVNDGADFTMPMNVNLIQKGTTNNNSGNITVKRDVSMKRLEYVYWSSPVAGQDLKLFTPYTVSPTNAPGFTTPTGSSRFYVLDEPTNAFQAIPEPLGVSFVAAKGYMLRAPNNFPANLTPATFNGSFNGIPNNGNISINVTNSNAGMNMIGNPYPSTIDTSDFLAANTSLETLYFWSHATANYATYNSTGQASAGVGGTITPNESIQVGQGFIAKTSSATTINFTNSLRVNDTQGQFFRGVANEKNRIWLNLSSENKPLNQILTGYITDATNDLDPRFDGKLFDTSGSKLYNVVNNSEYVIQGRALPFSANDVVALGFKAATPGNYTISLDHVDGLFSENQDIFIKDKLTGAVHNIKQGDYTFASEAGTFNERFDIVYQTTLGVTNPSIDSNSVIVFTKDNVLNITSGNIDMQAVKIFDIRGRLIFEQKGINTPTVSIANLKAAQQVLVVQVSADNKTISKKVVF